MNIYINMSMKIIEILQKEGIGKDLAGDAVDAAKGIGSGINAFVRGAGGPDIKGTFDKYAGDTLKGKKGTSRSIGRGVPVEDQQANLLKTVYDDNITDEILTDWDAALKSGKDSDIKAVGKKWKKSEKEPGDWKESRKDVIAAIRDYYQADKL